MFNPAKILQRQAEKKIGSYIKKITGAGNSEILFQENKCTMRRDGQISVIENPEEISKLKETLMTATGGTFLKLYCKNSDKEVSFILEYLDKKGEKKQFASTLKND